MEEWYETREEKVDEDFQDGEIKEERTYFRRGETVKG